MGRSWCDDLEGCVGMDSNQMLLIASSVAVCFLTAWGGTWVLRRLRQHSDALLQELIQGRETDAFDAGYRAGLEDSRPGEFNSCVEE